MLSSHCESSPWKWGFQPSLLDLFRYYVITLLARRGLIKPCTVKSDILIKYLIKNIYMSKLVALEGIHVVQMTISVENKKETVIEIQIA